jgi:oligopeptide transport system permease protein
MADGAPGRPLDEARGPRRRTTTLRTEDRRWAIRNPRREAVLRLRGNRMAMVGLAFITGIGLACLVAPLWVATALHFDPDEQNLSLGAQPPGTASVPQKFTHSGREVRHWFGTDQLGRDVLVRILYGGRVSLAVGLIATLISVIIGVLWGAIAGYAGGMVDQFMMRTVDVLYCLPYMFFVILLMVVFGRNILLLFVAIGAVEWLTVSRIVRGQVIQLKEAAFVQAARSMGASSFAIVRRHLVPNVMGTVVVYATLTVPSVMLQESFLSFLGLGVQPPMASWGSLANEGADTIDLFPWLMIFPGLVLSATLFSFNFLGDGLRDALDPRGQD